MGSVHRVYDTINSVTYKDVMLHYRNGAIRTAGPGRICDKR
jgi:hypothetical protein